MYKTYTHIQKVYESTRPSVRNNAIIVKFLLNLLNLISELMLL